MRGMEKERYDAPWRQQRLEAQGRAYRTGLRGSRRSQGRARASRLGHGRQGIGWAATSRAQAAANPTAMSRRARGPCSRLWHDWREAFGGRRRAGKSAGSARRNRSRSLVLALQGPLRTSLFRLASLPEASNQSRAPATLGSGAWKPQIARTRSRSSAGWHARMSSRLAGKGACACSSDQVSNIRLWPSPREDIGATR